MISIYLVTDWKAKRQYIGQTRSTIRTRWGQHCRQAQCRRLHRAIQTHGREAFTIEKIAEAATQLEADVLETGFISLFGTKTPSGYNIKEGGHHGGHSEETRRAMSERRRGQRMTGRAAKGVPRGPRPEIIGQRISAAKKGRPNGLLGRKRPYTPHMARRKPVLAYRPGSDVPCQRYGSLTEASQATGVQRANMIRVLKGDRPLAGGYIWRYEAQRP